MKSLCLSAASLLLVSMAGWAAEPAPPAPAKVFDRDLTNTEREVVSLAEAMPEDKYNFAPTDGSFQNVRTFAQQMKHIAAVNHLVAASLLGEKGNGDEAGPADVKTKAQIVQFLKDSFAHTHKATLSVTEANLMSSVANPFGKGEVTRLSVVTIPVWHTYDHYGQSVVYLRMNGVVPPASR